MYILLYDTLINKLLTYLLTYLLYEVHQSTNCIEYVKKNTLFGNLFLESSENVTLRKAQRLHDINEKG